MKELKIQEYLEVVGDGGRCACYGFLPQQEMIIGSGFNVNIKQIEKMKQYQYILFDKYYTTKAECVNVQKANINWQCKYTEV